MRRERPNQKGRAAERGKTMKKALSLVLSVVMLFSLLAGCNNTADEPSASTPVTSTAPVESDTPTAEPPADATVSKPDGYPSKAISWIVPAAAGAALDLPTRALADVLDLGQPVVPENIAGASQTLGTAEAAARDADGYTLLTMANACGISMPIMGDVSYDIDDFRFIAMLAPIVQATLCVKKGSELADVDKFIEYVKNNEYQWGSPNMGGYGHFAAVSTLIQLGAYDNGMMLVYNGSNDNIMAILNNEVDFAVVDTVDAIKHLDELDVVVVLDETPYSGMPDTPIMSDYGVENLGLITGMKWIAVRKDTPNDIVEWLKQELNAAIQSDTYQQYLVDSGLGNVREYSEEELTSLLKDARVFYKQLMEETGMI